MKKITMKDKMIAFFRNEQIDRIPFVHVDNLVGKNEEIWSEIGRENMGLTRWSRIHRFQSINCKTVSEKLEKNGLKGIRNTIITPIGNLFEDKYFDPAYMSEAYSKHFIVDESDYKIFNYYLKDLLVLPDHDAFLKDQSEVGDDGLAMAVIYRTPYQKLWIECVSIEDLSWHMLDNPEVVQECVKSLVDIQKKIFHITYDAVDKLPIHLVNIPDNITAPLIGESNFRKYCVPYYNELSEMLANKDTSIVVHMDGSLQSIWAAIRDSKFDALDSFTPAPDNDTGVRQALDQWPDKKLMCNFPSSVHLESAEKIFDQAVQILEESRDTNRLWLQISENMPTGVWRKSFPQIIKAINEFSL